MFAWLPMLASLANLFAFASGQPEEQLAILKTPIAEVSVWLFCINFPNLGSYFIGSKCFSQTNKKFKQTIQVQDLGTDVGLGTAMDIGTAGKLPIEPENELETGKLIAEFEDLGGMPKVPDLEWAKGSILDNDLETAR